ncbi:hypothetical protein ACOSP7_028300 [Xanthoceras sorbifolium]
MTMSNKIIKDVGLSGISNSSLSSRSSGRTADVPHPTTMVTATGVIDLNPMFGEPSTIIVDDVMEGVGVGEASADEPSTSGAVALKVGGGFLPLGLSSVSILTDSDLLYIRSRSLSSSSCLILTSVRI